ncbi:MAG TPA: hypothetical protein VK454_00115 [Myxococcaceae bacterium]|nr:hypothetical protein [Myxococcaceae bacterium]
MLRRGPYAVVAVLWAAAVGAAPVTYTGFTIADGQLGSWSFHNARVYLTFQGDTKDVQFIQPLIDPTNPSFGTVDAWALQTGVASVTIFSGGKRVHATFAPNQILVTSDLGDTSDTPHFGARGMGFSSISPTGALEPAYPLGIEDGTVDWGDIPENGGLESPDLDSLSTDLQETVALSGRAWSCVGFPNGCTAPYPLHTNRGDLVLSSPYMTSDGFDSLAAGFFIVDVGDRCHPASPPRLKRHESRRRHPITYYGYLVSDVTLGTTPYYAAQVYLSYESDVSSVVPFNNGPGSHGFINAAGRAHLTLVTGGKVISADFAPGQIYVFYDVGTASVGFGSTAGGRAYPLSITANTDKHGLVENSSVGAVADLTTTPANANLYTAATATLVTDLTNETTLSGGASSCVAFDPITSVCSDFTTVGLQTNRGPFYLPELYYDDESAFGIASPYTISWGLFWSELGGGHGHDDDGRDDDDHERGSSHDGRD